MVLGLGHSVGLLSRATWLAECAIHFWGDIDAHGLAMLDRLRTTLPHARSLLMDRDTLLAHRAMWTSEHAPLVAKLDRLTPAEAELYSDFRFHRLGRSVRLEQERISFAWRRDALRR